MSRLSDMLSGLPEQEFIQKMHWRHFNWSRQPAVWLVALGVGIVAGYATIVFRLFIDLVSLTTFGATEASYLEIVQGLPGWQLILMPTLGGLAVGLILKYWLRQDRAHGVPDIIEARALHHGEIKLSDGLKSAVVSAVSLGAGASTGREGPAAHLGASLSSIFTRQLKCPPRVARILLAAGAASAVAASFNAPIAGVMFALEVILGYYTARAFAPIVIASVAGALICRLHIGDMPAFQLPDYGIKSIFEVPAFALLGVVAGLTAVLFMRSTLAAENLATRIKVPLWIRPALGGFLIGLIALAFPHVLGVGYGAVDAALKGSYGLLLLLALIAAKMVATSISLGSRFGGGVFSPSLFLGAMVGAAFGIIASGLAPGLASEVGLYAIIGMGAVSAAILGAPISTTLIVFELTGDYGTMIALMIATSIATVLNQAMFGRSFFHLLVERRGHHIADGPQRLLLETLRVRDVMTSDTSAMGQDQDEALPTLNPEDPIEQVFKLFEQNETETILVVERSDPKQILGYVYYRRALEIFNKSLIEANIEEHR